MRLLSNQHRYVKGQIVCRSLRPFAAGRRIVLALPGGPGLGAQYLEPFLLSLAKVTGLNVALLDLPNHGESVLHENGTQLDYPRTVRLLESAVGQIVKETGGFVLFGQSLGARLALDLLPAAGEKVAAVILTGLPSRFENSEALGKALAGVTLEPYGGGPGDEEVFAKNWRKVLPFYTPKPLPPEAAEQLAAGTKWRGNERMLEGAPLLDQTAERLKAMARVPPILVIQGDQDLVVPDGNLQALKQAIGGAEFRELAGAGHFVMVEQPSATVALISEFLKRAGGRK